MTFDIAKKISYAACELDWLKKTAPQVAKSEVARQIDILHECAIELAGKRVCEIYTEPYEIYSDQKYKNMSEPAVLAQVIEFCGHRKCDKQ
jgi:hypothetical protein